MKVKFSSGVVTRIIPIGAFVEILPGKEGDGSHFQLSEEGLRESKM